MQETEILFLFFCGLCLVVTTVGFAGMMLTRAQSLNAQHLKLLTSVLFLEAYAFYSLYNLASASLSNT